MSLSSQNSEGLFQLVARPVDVVAAVPFSDLCSSLLPRLDGSVLILGSSRKFVLDLAQLLPDSVALVGQEPPRQQRQHLKRSPRLVVATPQRLLMHLKEKNYSVSQLKCIILADLDRMMNLGVLEFVEQVLNVSPFEKQTLIFSESYTPKIREFSLKFSHFAELFPTDTVLSEREIIVPSPSSQSSQERPAKPAKKPQKRHVILDEPLSPEVTSGTPLMKTNWRDELNNISIGEI